MPEATAALLRPRDPGTASAAEVAARARAAFERRPAPGFAERRERLRALQAALRRSEARLLGALQADLCKPLHEAYSSELGLVHAEIREACAHLRRWMQPQPVRVPPLFWPARAWRRPEPRGPALIISPWNYPLALALAPVVGAVAAGCPVVLKPSEHAPATAAALAECLATALPQDELAVVQGGPAVATALLDRPWGLVFFIGSTRVGRLVMEAAARQLSPVVLELGGKNPCLVDEDTDLATTARRIAWGKFHNAGQTCAAPDYVLVHRKVGAAFLEQMARATASMYGDDPARSPDYARIVNGGHFQRLVGLMGGGRVVIGGQRDARDRYIAPTVLTDVDRAHPLMQEEIFGPLLPVIEVGDLDEAVALARARPQPLTVYVFSRDRRRIDHLLARIPSGNAVINDTLIHLAMPTLPLGGVGPSGMGSFHGKASFDAFTHWRSVLKKPFYLDLPLRYPPYRVPLAWLRRLIG